MTGGRRGGKTDEPYPSTPPVPRDVQDLQRQANALASQMLEQIQHDARPPKPKSHWWRVLLFPVTMRKFERVFFCQGESFVTRWLMAFRFSKTTLLKPKKKADGAAE